MGRAEFATVSARAHARMRDMLTPIHSLASLPPLMHACDHFPAEVIVGYNISDPASRYWLVRNTCEGGGMHAQHM